MNKISIQYFKTTYGELIMGSFNDKLCLCDWRYRKMRAAIDSRIQKGLNADYQEEDSSLIQNTKKQLNEYFNGERTEFDIPLLMVGTDFQQSVWQQLLQIPYGKTVSYLALAQKMDKKKAIRAIASANGANAISIVVPCHRIIGSDGKLVGYAGGLNTKRKLLLLEKSKDAPEQLQLFN